MCVHVMGGYVRVKGWVCACEGACDGWVQATALKVARMV